MLVGQDRHIGLSAGPDGVFMIDDQFAPLTPKILAAVGEISEEPIRFVLNTHWHFDHTGGNENLGKAGVAIVAHDNVRKLMSADQFLKAFGKKNSSGTGASVTHRDVFGRSYVSFEQCDHSRFYAPAARWRVAQSTVLASLGVWP